ncbi:hypothetical protein ACQP10_38260 (plasmid) [Streptosporangium sandarakinum]|uniref:hypothetical protein n=1 Tax=Streptosporangium sandarakinum TaxID=1260955 RepID=UPI003D94DAD9
MNTPIYDELAAKYAERAAAPELFAPFTASGDLTDEPSAGDPAGLPEPADVPGPAGAQTLKEPAPRNWFAPACPTAPAPVVDPAAEPIGAAV